MPQIDKHDWYQGANAPEAGRADAWYGRRPQTAPKRAHAPFILSLCALALAALTLGMVLFGQLFGTRAQESASGADGGAESAEALPPDMDEFFSSYYTSSSSISIAQAGTDGSVTLPFAQTGARALSLQEIYAQVSPAVVGITTYVEDEEYSWGTGVVFTADGYIVTNEHVLEGADAAKITFTDGSESEAKYVGGDAATDLAVLKIDAQNLTCAEFADSADCRVGDSVTAIGNPLGQEYAGTMTDGIISAIDRNVSNNGHTMTLLQTNAALNEGNSGGPLVNAAGQVVGITNMKIMSSYYTTVEGIGFAIPTSVVKSSVDEIMAYGAVRGEPTIGITAGAVPQEAMAQYDLPQGIYVSGVQEGSDAYAKGVRAGDVVTAVNGVSVSSVSEVNAIKESLSVGDTITLTIYRDGKTFDVDVVLVDNSTLS